MLSGRVLDLPWVFGYRFRYLRLVWIDSQRRKHSLPSAGYRFRYPGVREGRLIAWLGIVFDTQGLFVRVLSLPLLQGIVFDTCVWCGLTLKGAKAPVCLPGIVFDTCIFCEFREIRDIKEAP